MARVRPPRASDSRSGSPGWRAALIALAVVLTYANSLQGPFVLDDEASIVQNTQIRDWRTPGEVFLPSAESPVAGRPIVNLSFALNYAASGLDVRGYHLANIGLHLICALLAFGLIRRTLRLPRSQRPLSERADDLAVAAALVWAVHPLNSEVVNYVTQRSESMMAALLLLTIYAANRSLTDRRAAMWQSVAIVSCALGMLCKETMATAPVLVALYDRAFAFGSWRDSIRSRSRLYVGLAAGWIVLAFVVLAAPRAGSVGLSSGVSPWLYLLNQSEVIAHYLRLSVWPAGLVVFYGWPVALSVSDVWPSFAFVGVLAIATLATFVRTPPIGFPGAWFFITLAPASSVVPISTEVGAERRMYLPLLGIVVFAVVLIQRLWWWWRGGKAAGRIGTASALLLGGIVVTALAATTIARNREYASALSLAQSVVERRPTGIAYHILGEQLMLARRDEEAVPPLTEAVSRGDTRAGYPLGVALINTGRFTDALQSLEAFVQTADRSERPVPRWLEPPRAEIARARMLIARILASQKEWNGAASQAEQVLALAPADTEAPRLLAQALMNIGIARVSAGDIDGAVDAFRRATSLDPGNAGARNLLTMALKDQQVAAAAR